MVLFILLICIKDNLNVSIAACFLDSTLFWGFYQFVDFHHEYIYNLFVHFLILAHLKILKLLLTKKCCNMYFYVYSICTCAQGFLG